MKSKTNMYAVKAVKGKEYLYSKRQVIDLGKRTEKAYQYAIDSMNNLPVGHTFKCKSDEVWRLCDDEYMCKDYAEYKAIIGKTGFKVRPLY